MRKDKKYRQENLFEIFNKKRTELDKKEAFSDSEFFNTMKTEKNEEEMNRKRLSLQPNSVNNKEEKRYSWLTDIKDADGNPINSKSYDKRTLYIPESQWTLFTPFEKQFWEIKCKNYDRIVFFKKGKFYELYENDADIGASLFDLKITKRVNMRMAGIPVSSFEQWAGRFVSKGYSIVKVDQSENGIVKNMREKEGAAKEKIIKRETSSILTAGTLIDGDFLSQTTREYCMAIRFSEKNGCGVSFVDASTASFFFSFFSDDKQNTLLGTLLQQIKPKEVLYEKNLSSAKRKILSQVKNCQLLPLCPLKEFPTTTQIINEIERYNYFDDPKHAECLFGLFSLDETVGSSFGALLGYLRSLRLEKKLLGCGKFTKYSPLSDGQKLLLDGQTLVNLNILPSKECPNSLLEFIDHCRTPFGKRMLRDWVCRPLKSIKQISERQETVCFFLRRNTVLDDAKRTLGRISDIERITSRVGMEVCKAKDFADLLKSLRTAQELRLFLQKECKEQTPKRLVELLSGFPAISEIVTKFERLVDVEKTVEKGQITLTSQADDDYQQNAEEIKQNEQALQDYLNFIRKTVCSKTTYKSIGKEEFQLEIAESVSVGKEFFLLSKRDGWKRYWTPQLKKLAIRQRELVEVRMGILQAFFTKVQRMFHVHAEQWTLVSQIIGEVDCLCSLATLGQSFGEEKCVPFFREENGVFEAKQFYHPIGLGDQSSESPFIPNDISFRDKRKFVLLTGPNMGGKSTILRQTCLCIILAQIGGFVPAQECQLSVFDRIFTRIGANDNIIAGQSTFMIELLETARILKETTQNSFVVIDELGRGTSTFDGLAIAYSVLGYLANFSGCIGMFATHYKGLAKDYEGHAAIFPMHMDCFVEKSTGKVVFLYKITPGVALKSYGMNVASIAGIPQEIVKEADEISTAFEQKESNRGQNGSLCNDATKIVSLLHATAQDMEKSLKETFQKVFGFSE